MTLFFLRESYRCYRFTHRYGRLAAAWNAMALELRRWKRERGHSGQLGKEQS